MYLKIIISIATLMCVILIAVLLRNRGGNQGGAGKAVRRPGDPRDTACACVLFAVACDDLSGVCFARPFDGGS